MVTGPASGIFQILLCNYEIMYYFVKWYIKNCSLIYILTYVVISSITI